MDRARRVGDARDPVARIGVGEVIARTRAYYPPENEKSRKPLS